MVRFARARLGDLADVHLMRFDNVSWRGEFQGIWACASLLHVPAASFPNIASRLVDALRPGRAWYMSFKLGIGVIFLRSGEHLSKLGMIRAEVMDGEYSTGIHG
jgi:hypothetical protein